MLCAELLKNVGWHTVRDRSNGGKPGTVVYSVIVLGLDASATLPISLSLQSFVALQYNDSMSPCLLCFCSCNCLVLPAVWHNKGQWFQQQQREGKTILRENHTRAPQRRIAAEQGGTSVNLFLNINIKTVFPNSQSPFKEDEKNHPSSNEISKIMCQQMTDRIVVFELTF